MITIIGHFLTQGNKDFPVDCELFDALQTNTQLSQIIGNIAGDKAILQGCELVGETKRNAGYVFLRTQDYPYGEVLYWSGGSVTSGMYVKLENIFVTAQGYEYPKAYTKRMLAPGIGTENYKWDDFKQIKTPVELEATIKVQNDKIAALAPEPLGFVKTWAGSTLPEGYVLCEGQQLRITDYPEFYEALGTTFNAAYDYSGSKLSTTSGYFRVPDLRGRFVVGQNPADEDYNKCGKAGGEKKHTLSIAEIPAHEHGQNLWKEARGDWKAGGSNSSPDSTSMHDRTTSFGKTDKSGEGTAHENRPPYYVLAYVMRTK